MWERFKAWLERRLEPTRGSCEYIVIENDNVRAATKEERKHIQQQLDGMDEQFQRLNDIIARNRSMRR